MTMAFSKILSTIKLLIVLAFFFIMRQIIRRFFRQWFDDFAAKTFKEAGFSGVRSGVSLEEFSRTLGTWEYMK